MSRCTHCKVNMSNMYAYWRGYITLLCSGHNNSMAAHPRRLDNFYCSRLCYEHDWTERNLIDHDLGVGLVYETNLDPTDLDWMELAQ